MQFQDFRQNHNILNNTRRTALYLVSKSNTGLLKYTPIKNLTAFCLSNIYKGLYPLRRESGYPLKTKCVTTKSPKSLAFRISNCLTNPPLTPKNFFRGVKAKPDNLVGVSCRDFVPPEKAWPFQVVQVGGIRRKPLGFRRMPPICTRAQNTHRGG